MKKFKLLLLLLLFLLPGKEVWGQKIFREGYIIKKNGESLYGLVQYSANQDVPSICIFKRFDIARVINYTSDEINAFGYKNGNRYESKDINNKRSFLEVFILGEITLYHDKSKYYIEKDHSGLIELKNGSIIFKSGGESKEFNKLPEFLRYITEGKTETISDRVNIKNEIIPLIVSYNKLSGKSYYVFKRSITEKQITQQAFESGTNKNKFGILSGANLYTLSVKPNTDDYSISANDFLLNPKQETNVTFGLTYERLLSRRLDNYSLRVDLLYTKQTFYSYGERPNTIGGTTRDDAYFGFTGIKIPLMFQYSLTGKRIVPFANAGISYQVFVDNNYYHVAEAENFYHDIITTEDNNIKFKKGELSAIGGIGLRTRIFDNLDLNISGRIEYGPGMFDNNGRITGNINKKKPFWENSLQYNLLFGITF